MISIIAAIGEQNQLGLNNSIPWNIPEDLQLFKKLTLNKTIIMGNNTFKSLGRLLPHRHHIVITSDKNIKSDSAQLEYWPSLNYKLEEYPDPFIIGGAQIYLKALELPECKFLHLSHIPYSGKADVFFPEINFNSWELIKKEEFSKFYYTLWKKIDF